MIMRLRTPFIDPLLATFAGGALRVKMIRAGPTKRMVRYQFPIDPVVMILTVDGTSRIRAYLDSDWVAPGAPAHVRDFVRRIASPVCHDENGGLVGGAQP